MSGILAAMDATVELANLRGMHNIRMPGSCLSYDHVKDMQRQMHEQPMDEGKLNRWLGWAQCAVVASGCALLDDMRRINKQAIVSGN